MRAAKSLREFIIDDSQLKYLGCEREIMSDLEDYPDTFVFHYCVVEGILLERVSL